MLPRPFFFAKISLTDGRITSGPASLVNKWPCLTNAGFDSVDAILPVLGSDGKAFFFRENKYVKTKITSHADDQIISGPSSVTSDWKNFSWI